MSTREEATSFPEKAAGPFHMVMMGVSYCDGSYRIKRGRTPLFVFEQVTKGKGILEIGGQRHEPCENDVYIVHGHMPHEYWADQRDPWEKIWFNVQGGLVESLVELYDLKNVFLVKNAGNETLEVFRRAQEEIRRNLPDAQIIAARAVHELIARLAVKIRRSENLTLNKDALTLKRFIDENYRKSPSLEDMAAAVGKSPSQTIRIFRSEWGSSPYRYLADRRIESAKLLLGNTGQKIRDIAFSLGFKDEYHFSTIFRKKTGISPKLFREKEV